MDSVSANTINKIDMNIKLDETGNANITETWDVDGSDGTEWYKGMSNLGNSELTDFTVSMDGTPLKYKEWNINESLNEKKGYYTSTDNKSFEFNIESNGRLNGMMKFPIKNIIRDAHEQCKTTYEFIMNNENAEFYNEKEIVCFEICLILC